MKNIAQLMQKAQQVQTQMTVVQNKLEKQEFVGEAANGAIAITMTGKGVPVKVSINASVVDKDDVETLEDLILIALKDAKSKADLSMEKEMERMQNSLGLPAGFKMPF